MKDVRYRPGDKVGDDKNVGTLRLSSLSKASLNEAQREEKLAKLSPELRDRVERKKLELELVHTFSNCNNTYVDEKVDFHYL